MKVWMRFGEFLQFLTMTANHNHKLSPLSRCVYCAQMLRCTVMAYLSSGGIPRGRYDLLGSVRRIEQLSDHLQSETSVCPRDEHRVTL